MTQVNEEPTRTSTKPRSREADWPERLFRFTGIVQLAIGIVTMISPKHLGRI